MHKRYAGCNIKNDKIEYYRPCHKMDSELKMLFINIQRQIIAYLRCLLINEITEGAKDTEIY